MQTDTEFIRCTQPEPVIVVAEDERMQSNRLIESSAEHTLSALSALLVAVVCTVTINGPCSPESNSNNNQQAEMIARNTQTYHN